MRIENFRTSKIDNLARVSATLIWEDRDRQDREIYFETTTENADSLWCNPNAFLIAAAIPAMRFGEQRVAIDGEICPELKDGLETAMSWLCHWHGGDCVALPTADRKVVSLEAKIQSHPHNPPTPPRAGVFLSGGIDALTALVANRRNFPLKHPGSFKDGFLISGFVGGLEEKDPDYEIVTKAVKNIAEHANLNLIPVSTNIYTYVKDLDTYYRFFEDEFFGALLSAVGHAFSRKFTNISIASGPNLPYLEGHGSHPCLDPNYSSSDLKIKHENLTLSRLEKTKLVMEWEILRQNLCVCNEADDSYKMGLLNCGKCEKCIRTMTALTALGILERVPVFPELYVSEELLVQNVKLMTAYHEACYLDTIELLKVRDRHDLVRGINRVVDRYHERDLKGTIKRFDRTFFNGNLNKLGKRVISR